MHIHECAASRLLSSPSLASSSHPHSFALELSKLSAPLHLSVLQPEVHLWTSVCSHDFLYYHYSIHLKASDRDREGKTERKGFPSSGSPLDGCNG